ncbi:sperm acrosome-associated protein 9 isoform X2 [Hyperolius riggenbachi]|uniref:sperm acrosome-associated protein 9 isoform X2 n=1 Tax=Hyperolius riggenbachi TaxID=752182 RepID=UPI0035A38BAE
MEVTMNEARQNLKIVEQRCKLLQQQQITFITALERTRESAHDKIKPVRTLSQVRHYLDNYCNNSTDKRILTLYLDVCADLAELCVKLESIQNDTRSTKGLIEQTITLLNPTNDLSALRAKYPHDVVNHLSCDEARNFYGGVVSLVPIVLDNIREAISRLEKAQPHVEDLGSKDRLVAIQRNRQQNERKTGSQGVTQNTGVQTNISRGNSALRTVNRRKGYLDASRPAWRPSGK